MNVRIGDMDLGPPRHIDPVTDSPIRLIEGEFQRVVVGENEVIVLTIVHALSDAARHRMHHLLKDVFPNQKCLILEEGMKIGAIGPCEKEKK